MRKTLPLLLLLPALFILGCIAPEKARKNMLEYQVKPLGQITTEHDQAMSDLKKQREKDTNEYMGEYNQSLNGYEGETVKIREDTKKTYEGIRQAVDKEIERMRKAAEEREKELEKYKNSLPK